MEGIMLEMTSTERQYRQKMEVGMVVSILLHLDERLSEESLIYYYKRALKVYRQSQIQHEYATLKPWQKKVMALLEQPTHQEVIWIVG